MIMAGVTKKIGEGLFYSSLGNLVIKGISLVGYLLMVNRLAPHDYGVFLLVVSLTAPVLALSTFGFDRLLVSAFSQFRGQGEWGKARGLFREYSLCFVAILAICISGQFLLREWLIPRSDIYLLNFFLPYLILLLGQAFFNLVLIYCEANEMFRRSSSLQVLEPILRTGLVVFFLNRLDISLLLIIYGGAKLVPAIVGWINLQFFSVKSDQSNMISERGVLYAVFRQRGKWEMLKNVCDNLISPWKTWVIKLVINVETVAVWDFAQNLYSAILGFFPIKAVLFPIISRIISDRELASRITIKARKYAAIFYLFSFVVGGIALKFLLHYYFLNYAAQYWLIMLVVAHLFIESYRIGQVALLHALNQQKYMFQMYPIFLGLELVLYVSFSLLGGFVGYILAWHLIVFLAGYIYDRRLRQYLPIGLNHWRSFLTFDQYDRWLWQKIGDRFRLILSRVS